MRRMFDRVYQTPHVAEFAEAWGDTMKAKNCVVA